MWHIVCKRTRIDSHNMPKKHLTWQCKRYTSTLLTLAHDPRMAACVSVKAPCDSTKGSGSWYLLGGDFLLFHLRLSVGASKIRTQDCDHCVHKGCSVDAVSERMCEHKSVDICEGRMLMPRTNCAVRWGPVRISTPLGSLCECERVCMRERVGC